jgi:FkbM family methyltransferase
MNDQTWSGRIRESAKIGVRTALFRANLDLGRDPYSSRLARTLRSQAIDTVLDVGANVGQFATLLRNAGYRGRIISVEPLSGAYAQLHRRAARDGAWQSVNAAIGDAGTTAIMHVSANSFSSSILPMTSAHVAAAPGSESIGTEEVAMTGVPDLVTKYGVDPAHTLLKIDTQGFEGHVLDSAADLVGQFAAIQLEMSFVELYAGQPLFEELKARMEAAGLSLWSLDAGISDQQGRLLQCDGLFLRLPEGV